MTEAEEPSRRRGNIRQRGSSLQVRLFADKDPVTGRDVYLTASIPGTDKKARKKADDKLAEFRTRVNKQRSTQSSVKLGYAIHEWMRTSEHEDSTREGYLGYIARTIRPALGDVPITKITARMLENFYTELRHCRVRCDGRPFIEHRAAGEHDCGTAKCAPHVCKPMAASTVHQIHSILSGTLDAAVRWDWISTNPTKAAKRPKQKPPQPDPPSPTVAAQLVEAAFDMDDDWGTLVWLVMTTGIRRGEVCALRWSRVNLDEGVVEIRSSYLLRRGVGKEKDTKTHQMRRIALDTETIVLLGEHKDRCQRRMADLGIEFTDDMYMFSGVHDFDPRKPYSPHAVSSRYKDMAERLGINTHIHALRHYSATKLLSAGIDLRTVAGRLGHGGGGATTLRVYAAWVAASDRKAAEVLGSQMPKRSRRAKTS
jgi:integrase